MSALRKKIGMALLLLFVIIALIVAFLFYKNADAVPVLNYHQINDVDHNALTVNSEQFAEQMQYLHDHGYHAITPEAMTEAFKNGKQLPDKPVIITFDDGYMDNYKNAFPILQKYGLQATIFLISDYVGTYPNYLTWTQIKEMQSSGVDFESHTLSHVELTKISPAEAENQLKNSKAALEWHLKKPVRFIAYPCGSYDDTIEELTRNAGYTAAFTVNYGLDDNSVPIFGLNRVPIFGSNSHTLLRFKMRLALAPVLVPLNNLKISWKNSGHTTLASFIPIP